MKPPYHRELMRSISYYFKYSKIRATWENRNIDFLHAYLVGSKLTAELFHQDAFVEHVHGIEQMLLSSGFEKLTTCEAKDAVQDVFFDFGNPYWNKELNIVIHVVSVEAMKYFKIAMAVLIPLKGLFSHKQERDIFFAVFNTIRLTDHSNTVLTG